MLRLISQRFKVTHFTPTFILPEGGGRTEEGDRVQSTRRARRAQLGGSAFFQELLVVGPPAIIRAPVEPVPRRVSDFVRMVSAALAKKQIGQIYRTGWVSRIGPR